VIEAPPGAGFFAAHTAAGLAADLRAGRLTPADLVDHAFADAARLGSLNAFVTLDEPGARAAARRAAEELAAGVDRGPLHGIPVAVKDLVDTAGLRTTMGSRHFADHVPELDAECVRLLREAGAVVVGKTVTHEFAYGPTGDRSAHGPARNPYRPSAMSGGSSAGSAVAVAAGIVPLAVGTDTGGSVRIPAACCGVTGLRPTYGAVAVDGVFPLSPTLDAVGPIARTVDDCRLMWHALGGKPDARAPAARIGWVRPWHPTDPAVADIARRLVPGADEVCSATSSWSGCGRRRTCAAGSTCARSRTGAGRSTRRASCSRTTTCWPCRRSRSPPRRSARARPRRAARRSRCARRCCR
jgi:aspartyl-tRNA(Asn)/glutamyl-tRNA(Gln) amidotransferase subunit A